MTKPASSTATDRLLQQRYGLPSSRQRALTVVVITLGVGLLLVWLGWAAWHQATTGVSADIVSFDVASAHRVDVTVDIHRPTDVSATCTVKALAVDHSIVGQTDVTVPADSDPHHTVELAITTEREATAVDVTSCR